MKRNGADTVLGDTGGRPGDGLHATQDGRVVRSAQRIRTAERAGQRKWGPFSSLGRRIMAINLFSVMFLAGGVLYLDQFRTGLIEGVVVALGAAEHRPPDLVQAAGVRDEPATEGVEEGHPLGGAHREPPRAQLEQEAREHGPTAAARPRPPGVRSPARAMARVIASTLLGFRSNRWASARTISPFVAIKDVLVKCRWERYAT